MSVSGLCQICEDARARYTCKTCGAAVCEAHFDSGASLCTECAPGQRPAGRETRDVDPDVDPDERRG